MDGGQLIRGRRGIKIIKESLIISPRYIDMVKYGHFSIFIADICGILGIRPVYSLRNYSAKNVSECAYITFTMPRGGEMARFFTYTFTHLNLGTLNTFSSLSIHDSFSRYFLRFDLTLNQAPTFH